MPENESPVLTGYDRNTRDNAWLATRGLIDAEIEHETWATAGNEWAHVKFATVELDARKDMIDVGDASEFYALRAPVNRAGNVWQTESHTAYVKRHYGDLENLSRYDKSPLRSRPEFLATAENESLMVYVPAILGGSDYSGGSVTRANFNVFADKFKASKGETWWELYGGHGTYAIAIAAHCWNSDMIEFFERLADYSCADEDELAEVEREAEDEAWENWIASDFAHGLKARFSDHEDAIDDVEREDLRKLLSTAMERANEYFEHESGGGVCLRLENVIAAVNDDDIAALVA